MSQYWPDPLKNGDIRAFAHSHSWYKHLSLHKPSVLYLIPALGTQPAQSWDENKDMNSLHWYFILEERDQGFNSYMSRMKDQKLIQIVKKHPVNINAFIFNENYGHNKDNFRWPFPNLYNKNEEKDIRNWLQSNYPIQYKILEKSIRIDGSIGSTPNDSLDTMALIMKIEYHRQEFLIQAAAKNIWDDLIANGYTEARLSETFASKLKAKNKDLSKDTEIPTPTTTTDTSILLGNLKWSNLFSGMGITIENGQIVTIGHGHVDFTIVNLIDIDEYVKKLSDQYGDDRYDQWDEMNEKTFTAVHSLFGDSFHDKCLVITAGIIHLIDKEQSCSEFIRMMKHTTFEATDKKPIHTPLRQGLDELKYIIFENDKKIAELLSSIDVKDKKMYSLKFKVSEILNHLRSNWILHAAGYDSSKRINDLQTELTTLLETN